MIQEFREKLREEAGKPRSKAKQTTTENQTKA
jgi:hypothetical protein